nr:hypothetical protein [Tanacetum cinerariifolium]
MGLDDYDDFKLSTHTTSTYGSLSQTSDPEVTYTSSITKKKAARYEIKGVEGMVPTLWSTIKHVYDKDTEKGIKHWGERRDFVDLHLNDIEDMLLLDVQHKLFHLDESVIVDFIVALQIEFKEPYTPSYDPPGIVYEDLNKQKRVLRGDELYKFSNGILKSVRDEIHHRVLDFRLDYNKEMPNVLNTKDVILRTQVHASPFMC